MTYILTEGTNSSLLVVNCKYPLIQTACKSERQQHKISVYNGKTQFAVDQNDNSHQHKNQAK